MENMDKADIRLSWRDREMPCHHRTACFSVIVAGSTIPRLRETDMELECEMV